MENNIDIQKLTEDIKNYLHSSKTLSEAVKENIETLKQILRDEKEAEVEGDTIYIEGNWDHIDPTTYSEDEVDGRLEGYVLVEENDDNTWQYDINLSILERVYVGKDEDGYPDFDYVDTDQDIHETKSFETKEQAIDACIEYINDFGELDYVKEA